MTITQLLYVTLLDGYFTSAAVGGGNEDHAFAQVVIVADSLALLKRQVARACPELVGTVVVGAVEATVLRPSCIRAHKST